MPELADIRAAIAANLETLNNPGVLIGGHRTPLQVSPYMLDDPTPPAIVVYGIQDVVYPIRGDVDLEISVQAFVGASTEKGPQVILDRLLLGDDAVKPLIETVDSAAGYVTLGGTVASARVTSQSGHKHFVLPSTRMWGAEWIVQVVLTD